MRAPVFSCFYNGVAISDCVVAPGANGTRLQTGGFGGGAVTATFLIYYSLKNIRL